MGIGNEVKNSVPDLDTLVRCKPSVSPSGSELLLIGRHVRGVVWHPKRNFPPDEQHVSASGLSVAVVHDFPNYRVLVLHCCLVVAAVTPAYGSP